MVIIEGICEICGESFTITYASLKKRTRCDILSHQICNKCILKYVTSSEEWRKSNSKAQKIAQNRPEVLEKMRIAVKASKTPEVLKRHSEASKKMWKDSNYREKHAKGMKKALENMSEESYERMTRKNRFYSGWYNSVFGKIFFNSSWELAFIIWCEQNKEVKSLTRCKDKISYKDKTGKIRFYLPDFDVVTEHNSYIIEIKGRFNFDNVEEKKKASDLFYKNKKNYCLWFKRDLLQKRIITNNFNAKEFCLKHQNKIEGLNINGISKKENNF